MSTNPSEPITWFTIEDTVFEIHDGDVGCTVKDKPTSVVGNKGFYLLSYEGRIIQSWRKRCYTLDEVSDQAVKTAEATLDNGWEYE